MVQGADAASTGAAGAPGRRLSPWHLLLIPWVLYSAASSGLLLCLGFRTGWSVAVLAPMLTPLLYAPTLLAALAVLNLSRHPRRDLAAILLAYLLGATLSWGWLRADDAAFVREFLGPSQNPGRANWWPYSNLAWMQYDENGEVWIMD